MGLSFRRDHRRRVPVVNPFVSGLNIIIIILLSIIKIFAYFFAEKDNYRPISRTAVAEVVKENARRRDVQTLFEKLLDKCKTIML